jgi:hypothetical protein
MKKYLLLAVFVLSLTLFVSASVFALIKFINLKNELDRYKNDPNLIAINQNTELLSELKKIIDLPLDEEPNIVTILDMEKLKDQPFFAKAKVGDKVVIYVKSKKAILYDPSNKKILEIGPLLISSPSATLIPEITISPSKNIKPTVEPTIEPTVIKQN